MKLLAWLFGLVFAVWLVAFVSIKIYDLDCIANPSLCLAETGIWLRKFVLLEWASKWQTLIAGALAITGGLATIWSARITLSEQQNSAKVRERAQLIANISYVAELFRRLSLIGPGKRLEDELSRWENVSDRILTLTAISPQLAIDVLGAWNVSRMTAQNGGPTGLGLVLINTISVITTSLLNHILNDLNEGKRVLDPVKITADSELVVSMQIRLVFLQYEQKDATAQTLISLSEPISNYVDFSNTSLDPRQKQ